MDPAEEQRLITKTELSALIRFLVAALLPVAVSSVSDGFFIFQSGPQGASDSGNRSREPGKSGIIEKTGPVIKLRFQHVGRNENEDRETEKAQQDQIIEYDPGTQRQDSDRVIEPNQTW